MCSGHVVLGGLERVDRLRAGHVQRSGEPGNVRQLRNVIDSAIVMAEGNEIQLADLGIRETQNGELETLKIDHWERKLIGQALKRTNGSVPKAAELLGISRATLYRKIDEYGIERK